MEQLKFGDVLRQTRERKGLAFGETAQRLRIRPDILRAMEESDIAAMPPRGYARNMVTGYARYLGLNPTELGSLYLAEVEEYDNRRARVQARMNGQPLSEEPRRRIASYGSRLMVHEDDDIGADRPTVQRPANAYPRVNRSNPPAEQQDAARPAAAAQRPQAARPSVNRPAAAPSSRSSANARPQGARAGQNQPARPAQPQQPGQRMNPLAAAAGTVVNAASGLGNSRKRPTFSSKGGNWHSNGPMLKAKDYVSFYDKGAGGNTKLPFFLAAIIILLVLILLGVFVFGHRGSAKSTTQEVATMPVTSVSTQSTSAAETQAPTSFNFSYSVDEGVEVWIEVYVDGEQKVADTIVGKSEGKYDNLTGEVQFISSGADGVHVMVDNQEQTLTPDGDGLVNVTYKFQDILKKWQEGNGVAVGTGNTSPSDTSANQDAPVDNTSSDDTSYDDSASYDDSSYDDSSYYDDSGYYDDTSYTDDQGY